MEYISRNPKYRDPGQHLILKDFECKEHNISYKPWRECVKGEWGRSDDGYVGECLDRMIRNDAKGKRVSDVLVFSFGKVSEKAAELLFEPRKANRDFHSMTGEGWLSMELKKDRAKRTIKAYAIMQIQGKIDWEALGQMYRQDQKNPIQSVKRLFRQERTQQMITAEIEKVLREKGIDPSLVLDMYLKAKELAEKKEDLNGLLRTAEDLTELLDMKPRQEKFTHTLEVGITSDIAKQIQEAEAQIVQPDRLTEAQSNPLAASDSPGADH